MIGSGLKKLARTHGMTVYKGIAYGDLGGFSTTLSEGAGWKQIVFTTTIADPLKQMELQTILNGHDMKKEFRVTDLRIAPKSIHVMFHDTMGTMKKVYAFLDFFLPLLRNAGATGSHVCVECGCEVTGGCWKCIGGVAYYLHSACADKVCRDIEAAEENRREEARGNYITGFVGALIGALLGAVVWTLVLMGGYVMSVIGLLIGFLAEKGYNLFRGKQGKGKVLILILAVIVGVIVGNMGAEVVYLFQMMNRGEIWGYSYADIPALILLVLVEDPEYLRYILSNMATGLMFAGLGVWSLLRRANAEVSATKVVDLK